MIDGAIRPANPDFDPLIGRTPADYPFLTQAREAGPAPERAPLPASPSVALPGAPAAPERYYPSRLPIGADDDPGVYLPSSNPITALREEGIGSAFVNAVMYQLRLTLATPIPGALEGTSAAAMQMLSEGMPEPRPVAWGEPPAVPTGNVIDRRPNWDAGYFPPGTEQPT
jgi:hypothetical protein